MYNDQVKDRQDDWAAGMSDTKWISYAALLNRHPVDIVGIITPLVQNLVQSGL